MKCLNKKIIIAALKWDIFFGPFRRWNRLTIKPSPWALFLTLGNVWVFIVLSRWHSLCFCNKMSGACGIILLLWGLKALHLTAISLSQPQVASLAWETDKHFSQYTFNLFLTPFEFSFFFFKKKCVGRLCPPPPLSWKSLTFKKKNRRKLTLIKKRKTLKVKAETWASSNIYLFSSTV